MNFQDLEIIMMWAVKANRSPFVPQRILVGIDGRAKFDGDVVKNQNTYYKVSVQ